MSEIPAKRLRFDDSESDSQSSVLSNLDEKLEKTVKEQDPPLHRAIIAEDIDLINKILSSGVDVDAFDKEKLMTALHLAVRNKYLPAIECLLEYGADLSANNDTINNCYGSMDTPLHFAVRDNRLDIVKLLLTTRIDLKKLMPNYKTVLGYAFQRKNFKLINYLTGNSYRADSKDFVKKASSFFPRLFQDGNQDLRNSLFAEYVSMNSRNSRTETPLIIAVNNKNPVMVEYLLENGADINANMFNNYLDPTALHIAVENTDEDMVKFLLNYDNCDVNAVKQSNLTPLHIAVSKNNLPIVKLLIEKNAKHIHGHHNTNYDDKITPFHISVYKNLLEMTEYFLDVVKIDVNIKTENGASALEVAAKANKIDMVKLLLKHGADVDYFHHEPKENLYRAGNPLHHAARNGNIEMVDLLLSKGANVDTQLSNGTTALHLAIKSEKKDIVKLLLDNNADVHVKMEKVYSYEAMTPIVYAAKQKLTEVMQMLVEKGANVNDVARISYKLVSIVDIAAGFEDETMLSMVLNLGADVNLSSIHEKKWHDQNLKRIVEKHVLKLKAAKLFVNEKLNSWISRGPAEQYFYNKCKKDVKKMQKEKISDSSFCYFDLLSENCGQIAVYVEANCLVEEFYKSLVEFPLYAELLTCNFQRGQRFKK